MNYINYIENTTLKDIYKTLAFEAFQEWNSKVGGHCKIDDKYEFLEHFSKYLYKAKLAMINKYPDILSKTDERFGYFLGYFSSTLTISWKEKYHLRYQKDYDKIVWIQSLNVMLKHDKKIRDLVKLIYTELMKQPINRVDIFNNDLTLNLSKIANVKFEIGDDDIEKNMLYLVTMILDKLDIENVRIDTIENNYMDEIRLFVEEPFIKIFN